MSTYAFLFISQTNKKTVEEAERGSSLGLPPAVAQGSPLHPFSISGFTAPGGPAQLKGVFAGWYLDVIALLKPLCCSRVVPYGTLDHMCKRSPSK